MSLGTLLVGSLVAWRVARLSHGTTVWLLWFLVAMSVSLGIWVIIAFRLLEGSFLLGCLVSILAIHVPALLTGTWGIRREAMTMQPNRSPEQPAVRACIPPSRFTSEVGGCSPYGRSKSTKCSMSAFCSGVANAFPTKGGLPRT